MKVWNLSSVFILFFSLMACTSKGKSNESRVILSNKPVISNQIFAVEIEGMVCKMGCGGSIRKSLIETKAVSRVEIKFQEDAKRQLIRIHFNNELISEKEIMDVLEKLNNHQFKVFPVKLSEYHSFNSNSFKTLASLIPQTVVVIATSS